MDPAQTSNQTELEILSATMAEIREQMAQIKEANADLDAEEKNLNGELDEARVEYERRVAEVSNKKKAIDDLLWESRKTLKDLDKKFQETDRRHAQALAIANAEDEFKSITDEWDEITADAPWRERALPHQLDGAKRVAFSRSTIVADVMGTGKTMLSIIALDMLLAAQPEMTVEYSTVRGYHKFDEIHATICATCEGISNKPDGPTYGDLNYDHYGSYKEERVIPAAGRKILYVAPVSLIRNVEREFTKWAPYREKPIVLTGYGKAQRKMVLEVVKDMDKAVVLVNYEAWRKDLSLIDDLIESNFDTIVIDEAHNLKNRRSVAYRGIQWLITGKRLDAQKKVLTEGREIYNVIPMTGSPILNKPQELYSLLTLVDRKQFPNSTVGENAFLRDYCYLDRDTNRWYFRAGGLENLARKISNRFIRRTRKDAGIILPPQEIIIHELEIEEDLYIEQAKARQQMRDNAMLLLNPARGNRIVAAIELSIRLRLRQIETWPAGIVLKDEAGAVVDTLEVYESQKLDYVIAPDGEGDYEGLLTEVCPEERTVVFSQFKEPLRELERRATAAGIRTVILDGGTPQSKRDEIAADFDRSITKQEDAKWDLVLANYKVGGLGLNFTGATQVIILDEQWNPGMRDQAYDRTNRIGQTEETTVHVIRMKGTTDVWMADLIDQKEGMIGGFNTQMSGTAFFEALRDGII
jgi:SNF2 family DNA or RNA helicase